MQAFTCTLIYLCVQPSVAGHFFGAFLGELVRHKYLRLPAACGCLRAALTHRDTALAMADLHTASYFCAWLKAQPLHGDARSHHTQTAGRQRILDTCAVCDMSLTDLIPQVIQQSRNCNIRIKSAACISNVLQCHNNLDLHGMCFCTCSMKCMSVFEACQRQKCLC